MTLHERAKSIALRVLRVPPEPKAPLGSPGTRTVFRASKRFYWYRLLAWAVGNVFTVGWAVIAISAVATQRDEWDPLIGRILLVIELIAIVGLVAGLAGSWFLLRLDWEMRWYEVTDRSLRIREGVVKVQETTMTFANVQNLSIHQTPLQRIFRIADLRIQSAGGGGSSAGAKGAGATDMHLAQFRGVDDAERIRDLVAARLRTFRDAGLGDLDDRDAEEAAGTASLVTALEELRAETAALRRVAESRPT